MACVYPTVPLSCKNLYLFQAFFKESRADKKWSSSFIQIFSYLVLTPVLQLTFSGVGSFVFLQKVWLFYFRLFLMKHSNHGTRPEFTLWSQWRIHLRMLWWVWKVRYFSWFTNLVSLTLWRPAAFRDIQKKQRRNARGFAQEFLWSGMLYRPSKSLKRHSKSSSLHSKKIFCLGAAVFLWVTS